MPELPEVETIVRELVEAQLIGLTIKSAEVFWSKTIAFPSAEIFCQEIQGQKILDIQRRGKYIVFRLSRDFLIIHLRMTGKILLNKPLSHSHERVRLHLDNGQTLHYEDQRKFGKWHLAHSTELLSKIGIEPLSSAFTLEAFRQILKNRKSRIKPFLLTQQFLAGIGNIYADEALWESKIHPGRSIDSLTNDEIQDLHRSIILVLSTGVGNIGTSLGSSKTNYYSVNGRGGNNSQALKVFRRNGFPCPRCQSVIKKIVLAQRGTHFCPNCQKT